MNVPIKIKYEKEYVQLEFILQDSNNNNPIDDVILVRRYKYNEFRNIAKELRINLNSFFDNDK